MKLFFVVLATVCCMLQVQCDIRPPPRPKGGSINIPSGDFDKARESSLQREKKRKDNEREAAQILKNKGKTEPSMLERFTKLSTRGKKLSKNSKFILTATNELINQDGSRRDQLYNQGTPVNDNYCVATKLICGVLQSRYRTVDGTCNNLRNQDWGSTFTAFTRHLRPAYVSSNGESDQPRNGKSPKEISDSFHTVNDLPNSELTLMTMQFGQFLDHDITHTPTSTLQTEESVSVDCCVEGVSELFSECFPIKWSGGCMNFVRSAPISLTKDGVCFLGPREQMNQITAFVDASNVYGSDDETMLKLYDHYTGHMLMHTGNLLPQDTANTCGANSCFLAGDVRSNEQVDLTVMHTVFMREHNRLADLLDASRPLWNGLRKFKEIRHVMAAIMQKIVYSEYLPTILGKDFVGQKYKLGEFFKDYDGTVNPSITNEFATAAYRFGHSQLADSLKMGSKNLLLSTVFFNPEALYNAPENLGLLVKGLLSEPSQTTDRFFAEEVTNKLFGELDLVALNLQRGRDHGIRPYRDYKNEFGQSISDDMSNENRQLLLKIYGDMSKVDLFTGGIAETPIAGGAVGKLFAEIIGEQFGRLKTGDRFFYQNGNHYTADAISEIDKISLSAILCRNGGLAGETIQRLAFKLGGPTLDCDSAEVTQWPDVEKLFPLI